MFLIYIFILFWLIYIIKVIYILCKPFFEKLYRRIQSKILEKTLSAVSHVPFQKFAMLIKNL